MPDWSYRTLLQPVLFALPQNRAHAFVVGFLGRMAAVPLGDRVVDLLGHMEAPGEAAIALGDLELSSRIGFASTVDPRGRGRRAFARFGVGWLTVGPVGRRADADARLARDDARRGLAKPMRGAAFLGVDEARRLRTGHGSPRLFFELTTGCRSCAEAAAELRELMAALSENASGFVVSCEVAATWAEADSAARRAALALLAAEARAARAALLVGLPVSPPPAATLLADLRAAGVDGVLLGGEEVGEGIRWGPALAAATRAAVTRARQALGAEAAIACDPGVECPRDALDALDAGADLVALSSGLVQTGPALAKRCNEAIAASRAAPADEPGPAAERSSWFWAAMLGAGMFAGALLAAWIALTTVLMPYDEEYLGAGRAEIAAFNPRILDFMTHDRITLAGTMLTIGILYFSLAVFGIRRGHHWAQRAVVYSAAFGFFTFFAFLGYGYLDPFHAFVTAILCQIFLLVVVLPIPRRRWQPIVDLDNDGAWRRLQWGQLLFVVHAGALLAAGAVIMGIGMTGVFVPQDIGFLGMQPEAIASFGPKLVPLIAHDRATFGGMLIASGLAILLSSLWGFRRGDGWQWWTFLAAAIPPYAATLWIHLDIGYVDHFHLAPVYIGLGLLIAGLASSREFLCARAPVVGSGSRGQGSG